MLMIFQRELLEHLRSLQFVILIVLSVLLFSLNGWISVKKYQERLTGYHEGVSATTRAPSTQRMALYLQPTPLILLADGGSTYQPPGYTLTPKARLEPRAANPKNFKMPVVPALDWAFILKVVFSLYCLLLAFRGICGERENGTLCLILSNPLKRAQLLLAKYGAIMATIAIPLFMGTLVSALIVSLFCPGAFSWSVFPRMVLMVLLGFFYLSLFTFLGLLVSSLVSQSSVSLLIQLAAWIVLVVILPNVSGILSDKLTKVPSEFQTARQVRSVLQEQVWTKIDLVKERIKNGELTTDEAIKKEADLAFEQGQREVRSHYSVYENVMKQRARLARNLSRFSPAALFQYAAESVADTGPNREARFLKDARAYARVYDAYIQEKLGKLVGTSPWSFSTSVLLDGQHVHISSPHPQEYQGDKSDFPRFVESKPNLAGNTREAFLDLGALALWNLIVAVLAFWRVSRCDVR